MRFLEAAAFLLASALVFSGFVACDETSATVDVSSDVTGVDIGPKDAAGEPGAPWVPPQSPSPNPKACYGVEGAGEPVPAPMPDAGGEDVADAASEVVQDAGAADGADDTAVDIASADAGPETCANCVGAAVPSYGIADFQPQSCSYDRVYGVDAFKSRPTVAVLLAAW